MQAMCELARIRGRRGLLPSRIWIRGSMGVTRVSWRCFIRACSTTAAGMISEADLMERVADAPSPLLLILDGVTDPT